MGTDGCNQTCTNTVGSYSCSCVTGYRLASDGHMCDGECIYTYVLTMATDKRYVYVTCTYADINECSEDTDGCAHTCSNTVGSYSCSCNTGYRLASDNHACNGMLFKIDVHFINSHFLMCCVD